jgi:hypothetical protein
MVVANRWHQPPDGIRFLTISAGFDHVCGKTTAGDVRCWGNKLR